MLPEFNEAKLLGDKSAARNISCFEDALDFFMHDQALMTIDGMTPGQLINGFRHFVEQGIEGLNTLRKARPFIEAFGFVPVAGDFTDIGLCLWDITRQKSPAEIGMSCVAIVPIVGSGATHGLRWGDDAARYFDDVIELGEEACRIAGSFGASTPVRMADGSAEEHR